MSTPLFKLLRALGLSALALAVTYLSRNAMSPDAQWDNALGWGAIILTETVTAWNPALFPAPLITVTEVLTLCHGLRLDTGLTDKGPFRLAVVLAWLLVTASYMLVYKALLQRHLPLTPGYMLALLVTHLWSRHPLFGSLVHTVAQVLTIAYVLVALLHYYRLQGHPPAKAAASQEDVDAESGSGRPSYGTTSEADPLLNSAAAPDNVKLKENTKAALVEFSVMMAVVGVLFIASFAVDLSPGNTL
ncbi:hypothetical protein HDU96_001499 [Phlyctochytrium bullatum]|nr:hypothetical protein HDU96_001499 [Phlyctochytrium bullatum]